MNNNQYIDRFELPNPIIELGKITFKEPLVCYDIEVTSNNIYFQWCFGMDDSFNVGVGEPMWLSTKSQKSDWKHKLIRWCEFNIGHAFFHACEDTNYTQLHWALYGNLKPLVEEIDEEYGLEYE